jgi:hypothetical protein
VGGIIEVQPELGGFPVAVAVRASSVGSTMLAQDVCETFSLRLFVCGRAQGYVTAGTGPSLFRTVPGSQDVPKVKRRIAGRVTVVVVFGNSVWQR